MDNSQQFCTFYLEQFLFGIQVEHVQEILRYQKMTPVPLANHCVKGLVNLRGQIVTAVDIRKLLNLPKRKQGQQPTNIVLITDAGITSLLVDSIGDVLELNDECFETPPETIPHEVRELILGVYKLKDTLLLALNPNQALSSISYDSEQNTNK